MIASTNVDVDISNLVDDVETQQTISAQKKREIKA